MVGRSRLKQVGNIVKSAFEIKFCVFPGDCALDKSRKYCGFPEPSNRFRGNSLENPRIVICLIKCGFLEKLLNKGMATKKCVAVVVGLV